MEKAVGHVINTVSKRHYKVNEQYLKRLLPYVEELGIMLENAVKMVLILIDFRFLSCYDCLIKEVAVLLPPLDD